MVAGHLTRARRREPPPRLSGAARYAARRHDFLPLEESAQLSAQLPMLVRGIYFEGWNPSQTPEEDRSLENFLSRTEQALDRALWNEGWKYTPEQAARAVLRVLSERVSAGEIDEVRHVLPEAIRELWPEPVGTR
ncbi:MAG: DUF2267 domain-containing protein [Thermomicrobiales bacterium]